MVLVGVTPFLFNWLGKGFAGGDALERYHNEAPSQWTGTQIHNMLSNHLAFLDNAFSLFELTERYIDLPVRSGAENLMQGDWKLGDIYADRQTDLWAPVEIPGSFDNTQITNFWMPGLAPEKNKTPEEMAEMSEKAIDFFKPLIDKLRARGGDVVFIRMPGAGLYQDRDVLLDHRKNLWEPMIAGFESPAINTMDYPELSTDLDIPEWSHFSRDSQDLWSARIVPYIEKAYQDSRGKSVYTVITPEKEP